MHVLHETKWVFKLCRRVVWNNHKITNWLVMHTELLSEYDAVMHMWQLCFKKIERVTKRLVLRCNDVDIKLSPKISELMWSFFEVVKG